MKQIDDLTAKLLALAAETIRLCAVSDPTRLAQTRDGAIACYQELGTLLLKCDMLRESGESSTGLMATMLSTFAREVRLWLLPLLRYSEVPVVKCTYSKHW